MSSCFWRAPQVQLPCPSAPRPDLDPLPLTEVSRKMLGASRRGGSRVCYLGEGTGKKTEVRRDKPLEGKENVLFTFVFSVAHR